MTDIDIIDLDPSDDALVDQCFDVIDASYRASMPGFPILTRTNALIGHIRTSREFRRVTRLAMIDGAVVGVAQLTMPLLDNTHLAECEFDVDPSARRRGVATALFEDVERILREDGRRTLHMYVPTGVEGGEPREEHAAAIAEKFGFEAGLLEVRRVCDLTAADDATLDALLDAARERADGFELRHWVDVTPDDLVDGVAYLDGRLLQDAPTGTLDIEPHKIDADRIRRRERERRIFGSIRIATGLVHRESGRLAGFTDIVVHAGDEDNCWQGITIVDPDFRGHRIGTILKIENHRRVLAHRPAMKRVHTWNAAVNDHMISINEAVGYRAADGWIAYERKFS